MDTNHAEVISSPLVPEASARLIKVIATEQIVSRWRQEFDADIISEFHGNQDILLYECESTGLRFFRPIEVAGSMAIYAILQKQPWYYGAGKWEHTSAIKDLAGANRIAEIGAGSGEFVRLAGASGLNVLGYEMSHAAIEKGKAEGIPLEYASVDDLCRDKPGSFDAACSFQVLEHIADPLPFIQGMFKLVRPGGRVLFSVPNNDGYLGNADVVLNLPPHHMSLWSRRALTSFAQFASTKLVCWRRQPLATHEVSQYLRSTVQRIKAPSLIEWALMNRMTNRAMRFAVRARLGHLWAGHTMYAVYEKL